ncbi:hypothetical protein PBF_20518 [Cytobacillus firmus DS1]|uniref:DUF1541 domain-containing protein n=1 Tax=Cytobacillus firmus DS1 TaxID=1307436 RepID=W7LB67_CYTFI|nr:hypothetical protein PBF_20518 [Cytobacillus firmus DS1]
MTIKILKISGLSLASLGIVFSAGGVSADAHNTEVNLQDSAKVKEELKVEKNLAKIEKKVNDINVKIVGIKASLVEPPLSAEEVERYKEYKEKIGDLLNRLNAVENHLEAKTKNSDKLDASQESIEKLINEVRLNALEIRETIELHFAETMSSSGEVPDKLGEAENPAFEIGSQAIIEADHMPGMKGAAATIAGAYETTAYSVTYYPTTGEEPVKDHKWVIHEEIENAGEEPLKPGAEVTLNADHMEGMDGAAAVIESAVETTVYMLDFTTTTGEKVDKHKWIIESELAPIQQ